jgi:transposase-like protein
MECVDCGSASISERRDCTANGYRRFRCRDCGRQFNERSGGVLNRTQYPSEVIALVVLRRLRYRRTLQDLTEMFLQRGIVFSHETVHEWEAKLTPILTHKVRAVSDACVASRNLGLRSDSVGDAMSYAPFSASARITTSTSLPANAVFFISVVQPPYSPFSELHSHTAHS